MNVTLCNEKLLMRLILVLVQLFYKTAWPLGFKEDFHRYYAPKPDQNVDQDGYQLLDFVQHFTDFREALPLIKEGMHLASRGFYQAKVKGYFLDSQRSY